MMDICRMHRGEFGMKLISTTKPEEETTKEFCGRMTD